MPAPNLATLPEFKAYLNISGTSEDGMLTDLLKRISVWMQQWLSRTIWAANYTEVRDGSGTNVLSVVEYPLISVSSVKVDGIIIPASTGPTSSGYFFSDTAIILRGSYRFTRGVGNVELAYNAGIAIDDATVPLDLKQACLELAAMRYKERERIGVSSKNLGPEQIQFITSDMPSSVQSLFNNYARRVPL